MYQAGVEWILGFRLRGTTLLIDPCIPRAWPGYEIDFRYHSASYEIVVENPHGVSRGVASVELDGADAGRTRCGDPARRRRRERTGSGSSSATDDSGRHWPFSCSIDDVSHAQPRNVLRSHRKLIARTVYVPAVHESNSTISVVLSKLDRRGNDAAEAVDDLQVDVGARALGVVGERRVGGPRDRDPVVRAATHRPRGEVEWCAVSSS